MTDLSPAAQAVMDAFDFKDDIGESARPAIAAALRAAALQLSKLWSADECIEVLQEIANELEGTT